MSTDRRASALGRDRVVLPLLPGGQPRLVVGLGDARAAPRRGTRAAAARSASTISSTAAAEAVGSPGRADPRCLARLGAFSRTLGVRRQRLGAARPTTPPQSVANPPGSISVTWMPKSATSWASAWREALERPLRGVVGADERERRDPADRGDLQDVAAALLPQERQRRLGHPHGAEDVGLQLVAELVLGQLLDEPEVPVAGVVDDDVEAAEVLVGLLDGGEVRVPVGDVELRAGGSRRRTSRRGRRGCGCRGRWRRRGRRARGRRCSTHGRSRGTCR